jgi:hypothetical protein
LKEIQPESVAEIELRVFDRFKTNFCHFGRVTRVIQPFLYEFRPFWPKTKLLCTKSAASFFLE